MEINRFPEIITIVGIKYQQYLSIQYVQVNRMYLTVVEHNHLRRYWFMFTLYLYEKVYNM